MQDEANVDDGVGVCDGEAGVWLGVGQAGVTPPGRTPCWKCPPDTRRAPTCRPAAGTCPACQDIAKHADIGRDIVAVPE